MQGKLLWAIYGVTGLIVVFAILFITGVIGGDSDGEEGPSANLTIWDLPHTSNAVRSFFSAYAESNKNVSIGYIIKNPETYGAELLNALAAGTGPDIFAIPSEEMLSYVDKVAPLGADDEFTQEFSKIAIDAVRSSVMDPNGNLYGVPVGIDTLVLFYNRDHLNATNIPEPPKTWEEFQAYSKKLTEISPSGAIIRSGAALGLGSNVAHAKEILLAMFLQAGSPVFRNGTWRLAESESLSPKIFSGTVSALSFFTSFANSRSDSYSWNSSEDSLDAFAAGKTSFAFGYIRDLGAISARNSHLNFTAAEFPQLQRGERLSYGDFTAFGVSRTSQSPNASWRLLAALFEKDAVKKIVDTEGLAPARRDLVTSAPPDQVLISAYRQALSAKLIQTPRPKETGQILRSMMDSVAGGASPQQALATAETKLRALIGQ